MFIVVEELTGTNTLTQSLRLPNSLMLGGIRLYFFAYNTPAGNFKFSIEYSSTEIFSHTFTASDVKTDLGTANDYFHSWYVIDLDQDLTLNAGTYDFKLTDTSGYSFVDDSSYVGWVKPHEDRYISTDHSVDGVDKYPFGIELWSYKL